MLAAGTAGKTYNIGGWNEKTNLDVISSLFAILDGLRPRGDGKSYLAQITSVKDRSGHDRRYAINATKVQKELGWKPAETFETGIRKTVSWYLDNQSWLSSVQSGAYREWIEKNNDRRTS